MDVYRRSIEDFKALALRRGLVLRGTYPYEIMSSELPLQAGLDLFLCYCAAKPAQCFEDSFAFGFFPAQASSRKPPRAILVRSAPLVGAEVGEQGGPQLTYELSPSAELPSERLALGPYSIEHAAEGGERIRSNAIFQAIATVDIRSLRLGICDGWR